jgi:hypothetical protein
MRGEHWRQADNPVCQSGGADRIVRATSATASRRPAAFIFDLQNRSMRVDDAGDEYR